MIPDLAPRRSAPTRALAIVVGVALILASALILLTSLDHATIVYSLPPNPTQGESNRHEVLWLPGVVASVLAGVALAGSVGSLIVSCVRAPSGKLWLIPVGLVVVVLVVAVIIGGLPMPAF